MSKNDQMLDMVLTNRRLEVREIVETIGISNRSLIAKIHRRGDLPAVETVDFSAQMDTQEGHGPCSFTNKMSVGTHA